MKFLMLIKHAESLRDEPFPEQFMPAMEQFMGGAFAQRVILDTAGLKPTKEARRYRLGGNKVAVTDGPFAETKELVGGFVMLAVDSEEEARSFAEQFIALHRDNWPGLELECELRAVEGS